MQPTLLVDFDGVIRDWPKAYDALEVEHRLPVGSIMAVAFERQRLQRVVTGRVSDDLWRQEVAEELGRLHPGASAAEAVAAWSESAGTLNAEVLAAVAGARSKCQLVLITNGTSRLPRDLTRLGLDQTFDKVINSSEIGFAKPDVEMFRHALALAGSEPHSTFFVDDSKSHVLGAMSLGITSHHYVGVAGLAEFLARHGLAKSA